MQKGLVLGERFLLAGRLGQGTMGEVWQGEDLVLHRQVAVKLLKAELRSSPQMAARFEREARIAAGLAHPGITTVFDLGRHEELLYFVMELLRGENLSDVLDANPEGLSIERAADLAAQVADAMAEAHAHGVVHRDLKPGNLMVLPGDRVKVCDFGIARIAEATTQLTATGAIFGTVAYMSPEQCEGDEVDHRGDLYSLGCVLHAMFTGGPPFSPAQRPHVVMLQHIRAEPPPVRSLRPEVPEPYAALVGELLAKDPADRPGDAAEVADRLRALERTRRSVRPEARNTEAVRDATRPPPRSERTAVIRPRRRESGRAADSPVSQEYWGIPAALDPAYREGGVADLRGVLADRANGPHLRIQAAEELASRSPDDRAEARRALDTLMRDPGLNGRHRAAAAVALASTGLDSGREVLEVCYEYVVGEDGHAPEKTGSIEVLKELSPDLAHEAAEVLRQRVLDPTEDPLQRCDDAEALVDLREDFRELATHVARRILTDPDSAASDIECAARLLAELGPEHVQAAADVVESVALDPNLDALALVGLASTLDDLGRERAARVAIRRAVADPGLSPFGLNQAALILAREHKTEAAQIYQRVVGTSGAHPHARVEAAHRLTRLGGAYLEEGVEALRALAADSRLSAEDRRYAVQNLAGVGPEYRAEAEERWRALA